VHWVKRFLICLVFLLLVMGSGRTEAPLMEEQMVYRLGLFDGKGYARSFCPRTEPCIYIIAGTDNLLLPTMTLVYYWPLTRRYRAGFKTLSEPVEGILEIIRKGKVVRRLNPQTYTFYYEKGWYAGTSEILVGQEAERRYALYQEAVRKYTAELKIYYDRKRAYRKQMEEFYAMARKRSRSRSSAKPGAGFSPPEEPVFPEAPRFFVQQPGLGYIVRLPVGRYGIRLRAEDGTLVEGGEKCLISFTHRRTGRVGYEVICAKRWTMPETSSDPSEIIYLAGRETLYFRPYIQTEYNHLYYSKLLDPQNEGYPDLWRWVNISQIERGTLELIREGRIVDRIQEKPYRVEQIPGPELGYRIVEFNKEKLPDRAPSLVGYRVDFDPPRGAVRIRLVDPEGKPIPGSVRTVRTLEAAGQRDLYLIAVFLPLVVGISMLLWRRWKSR